MLSLFYCTLSMISFPVMGHKTNNGQLWLSLSFQVREIKPSCNYFPICPQSPGRTNLNGWDPLSFPNKWHILSPEKICTIIEKALVLYDGLPSWVLHIHGAQKKRPFACETKTLNFRDRVRLWSSFSQGGGRLCRIKYKRLSCMCTLSAGIWDWTLFNRECFFLVWSRCNSLIGEPCVFGKEF